MPVERVPTPVPISLTQQKAHTAEQLRLSMPSPVDLPAAPAYKPEVQTRNRCTQTNTPDPAESHARMAITIPTGGMELQIDHDSESPSDGMLDDTSSPDVCWIDVDDPNSPSYRMMDDPTGTAELQTDRSELEPPYGEMDDSTGEAELQIDLDELEPPSYRIMDDSTGEAEFQIDIDELGSPSYGRMDDSIGEAELQIDLDELEPPYGRMDDSIGRAELQIDLSELESPSDEIMDDPTYRAELQIDLGELESPSYGRMDESTGEAELQIDLDELESPSDGIMDDPTDATELQIDLDDELDSSSDGMMDETGSPEIQSGKAKMESTYPFSPADAIKKYVCKEETVSILDSYGKAILPPIHTNGAKQNAPTEIAKYRQDEAIIGRPKTSRSRNLVERPTSSRGILPPLVNKGMTNKDVVSLEILDMCRHAEMPDHYILKSMNARADTPMLPILGKIKKKSRRKAKASKNGYVIPFVIVTLIYPSTECIKILLAILITKLLPSFSITYYQ